MRILILVFLLVFTAQAAPNLSWQTYGAVLKGQEAKVLLRQCSRATPQRVTAQWTPSKTQIVLLETKLPKFQKTLKPLNGLRSSFYRQYAGFVAAGRKIIYVNLFPSNVDPKWRSRAVVVCDGGEQFWGVEFEIVTERFVNPAFNGKV